MELLLGVDGGGSHTTALLATDAGEIIGRGHAAGSNPRALGFEKATAAILQARDDAFAAVGLATDTPLAAVCLGLAGVGRPGNRTQMEEWAKRVGLARHTLVVTDIEPILAAGTPEGWGIALISGTGSSCFARSSEGEMVQVGGWGYLLGDEGSGYDLALRALRLATQTSDGRADAHALLAAILAQWGLTEAAEMVEYVYERGLTRPELARLTRPLLAVADAGDAHALELIDRAATDLAAMAQTAARRLSLAVPPLALAGGLFVASAELRARLAMHLGAGWGETIVVTDPAQGSLLLARNLLHSAGESSSSI